MWYGISDTGKRPVVIGILAMSGETTQEIPDTSENRPHLVLQDADIILQAIQ